MQDVVLSFIINDRKCALGVAIPKMIARTDGKSLILSGHDNIEIIYPLNEIVDVRCCDNEGSFVVSSINGSRFEITIV